MDSEKTLIHRVPYIAISLTLIASVIFYFTRDHDAEVWQKIDSFYVDHLLQIEQPLFLDFYQKRLNIEQTGSAARLSYLSALAAEKQTTTLSREIISDRGFGAYLDQKAPLYFSDKQFQRWRQDKNTLKSYLSQLSTSRFAIIPESFRSNPTFASLFSYPFIDIQRLNLVSNLFLFLLLCSFAEQRLNRITLSQFLAASVVVHASLYLCIANILTPPLYGLNMQVYVLFSLFFTTFIRLNFPFTRTDFSSNKLFYSSFIVICLLMIGKIVLDTFSGMFNAIFLVCLAGLCSGISIISWFIATRSQLKQKPPEPHTAQPASLQAELRKPYSEALNAVSKFNFNYARQQLRLLLKEAPQSTQIVESSYHLEKLVPEDPAFWQLAKTRIEASLISNNYADMLAIFQDIQTAAPSKSRATEHISPEHYLKMLVLFVKQSHLEKAEHAFMFLELNGKAALVQEACRLLIEAFAKKHNVKKQQHYQALLDHYLLQT